MNADEREEIAASIAAHAELGPKYEHAVAEGLVERIGEEIDRRVDARLRAGYNGQPTMAATGANPAPPAPAQVPARRGGVSGVFLGLGSMGLGVGATAVIAANHVSSAAAVIMILLIWAVIAVINIAHSQRR